MKPTACHVCGAKTSRAVTRPFTTSYDGVPVRLDDVEMHECSTCGERTLSPDQLKAVSQRIKGIVRERENLLSPETIVAIRKRHKLTQPQLEGLLGVGRKVVTRWEHGTVVPAPTVDLVLRLIDRVPGLVDEIRKIRGEPPTSR